MELSSLFLRISRSNYLPAMLLLLVVIIYSSCNPTLALTCYCNECGDKSECNTSDHKESKCFMSANLEPENGTYVQGFRFGCLSGSDWSLGHLQCYTKSLKTQELIHMACCSDYDRCNEHLPSPTTEDDIRWKLINTPVSEDLLPQQPLNPVFLVCYVFLLIPPIVIFFYILFKVSYNLYQTYSRYMEYVRSKKTGTIRGDLVCSTVTIDDHLKSHFIAHHHSGSSTGSTHTYSISDYVSQKPDSPQGTINYTREFDEPTGSNGVMEYQTNCLENSSTLPDLTSGVGARILEPRTMARAVDSGQTTLVGSGRFGRVFKGTFHGDEVAVKAFRSIDCDSWRREENILTKLSHDNIVRFYSSETYTVADFVTETWMFLEFCPYGSLCDFLDGNEISCTKQAINILYSIIKGLSYLHEEYNQGYKPAIAHRDIKSRNILMKTPEICCIADFGHAVIKVDENKLDFGGYECLQVGTTRYMAPEILKPSSGLDITQFHTFAQADLYQFGLVLWEVCHRTNFDILCPAGSHLLPYDGLVPHNPDIQDMIKSVCEENKRPPAPERWSNNQYIKRLSALMVECWRSNPKARMETLGVKKKLRELHDEIMTKYNESTFFQNNIADNFNPQFYYNAKPRLTDNTR